MTATPATATTAPTVVRRDRPTYLGILAVALAAAVLSFASLTGLAELAGVTGDMAGFRLAWLLPVAIDAYALTATRVWLRTGISARTRAYARRCAVGAIVMSVAGNAAFHALTASGVGGLLAVAVSAVPPVMLGLVGHMHALVSADHRTSPPTVPTDSPAKPPADPAGAPPKAGRSRATATTASAGTGSPTAAAPSRKRAGAASGAEAVMREHWAVERAAGRTPSGAALDRVAGTRDYGRKVRRALLVEEAETATGTDGQTTTGTGTAPAPETTSTGETSSTTESESGKGLMRV